MRVAFDIDDTLFKLVEDKDRKEGEMGARCSCGVALKQEPDLLMIDIAHELVTGGHSVFLWSAGGVDHAMEFIHKHAPAWEGLVKVIPKTSGQDIDVCFDDQDVDLASVNLRIKREHSDHWGE